MSENQKGLIKLCKLCEEPLPKVVLAFSNRIAIEEGYCCWMCMNSDLGEEKAYAILGQKTKQNMHERTREKQSGYKAYGPSTGAHVRKGQATNLYGVAASENEHYVNQPPRENSLFYSVPHYFRGNGIKGLKMDKKGMVTIK